MGDDMIYTGEGTHKGWPYVMDIDMIYTGEGARKGCPYVMGDDMIYTGGRAPTRGAPTGWMTI